jgi:hypothetical protein
MPLPFSVVELEDAQTTATDGTQKRAFVSDDYTHELLEQILTELKKMNVHLSLITDSDIKDTEVE